MSKHIYCRILGYVVTIGLHVGNMVVMSQPKPRHLMADPYVRGYMEMRSRYLTRWTFFMQIFYAVCGLICDLLVLKNSSRKDYELPKFLKGFRDTLFAAVVWPATLLVFSFFWTVYLIDRSLIFPTFLDEIVSVTSNHIMHTAILPIAFWEVLFQPRSIPRSHIKNILFMALYFGFYLAVLIYTYIESRRWVYPVFQKIYGTIYFYVVICIVALLCITFYYIQWPLTRKLWGSLKKEKAKKKRRD